MARPPAQPNQSLIDGLEVLKALAVAREPVGSREMARHLGMEPTRINRLLKTLASLGMTRQDADRKYVPGPAMHVLSVQAIYGSGLLARAAGVLNALCARFQCDVALGVLWQSQVCYLYFASPGKDPADALAVRGLYPAEKSGVGLPLLAQLPEADVNRLYAGREVPGGIDKLQSQLSKIRQEGFARLSPRDRNPGAPAGVGIAIGNPAFAGLALAGENVEREPIQTVVAALRAAAVAIEA